MKLIMESWREFKRMAVNEITGAGGTHEETVLAGLESLAKDKNFLFGLPLHLRGFLKYVAGDNSPFTENNLTEKEIHLLSDFVLFVTRDKAGQKKIWPGASPDPGEKLVRTKYKVKYDDYDKIRGNFATQSPADPDIDVSSQVKDWPNMPDVGRTRRRRDIGRQSMPIFGGEFVDQLERFLGTFVIYFGASHLQITDHYDFTGSRYHKNKDFIEILSDAAALGVRKGSLYKFLRRLGPAVGEPFSIDIKIPYSVGRMTKEEI